MNSNSLVDIALAIAVVVIICLTLTFSLLYWAYGKYKRLSIKSGQEDKDLLVQIKKMNDKFIEKSKKVSEGTKANESISSFAEDDFKETSKSKNNELPKTYLDRLVYQNSHFSPLRIVYLTLYSFILAFIFIVMIICFTYRGSGEVLYISNTAYITIQTGSMSSAHDDNTYIKENNLTNQIEQYSLIGIEKIEEEELEVFDVVAFYIGDDIYVHRLINILEDENGVKHYCFRGDANNASFSEECYIEFDKIIGRYTGYQSLFLGVSITYLQSNIGIISMFMAVAFLINLEVHEELIDKTYYNRKKSLCSLLDLGEISIDNGGNK